MTRIAFQKTEWSKTGATRKRLGGRNRIPWAVGEKKHGGGTFDILFDQLDLKALRFIVVIVLPSKESPAHTMHPSVSVPTTAQCSFLRAPAA